MNTSGYLKNLNKVVCFEPDNDNYNYLVNICKNIEKNNSIDIICHNFGIFYGMSEAPVFGCGDNNVGGYFIDDSNTIKLRKKNLFHTITKFLS